MKRIARIALKIPRKISSVWRKTILSKLYALSFSECGRDFSMRERCEIVGNENVRVGNNVSLGAGMLILSTRACVHIGDDVMFGPGVSIISGDHRMDRLDKPMALIGDSEKLPENDADIMFEGDNWIGANSTILKGVTIGRGAVVAAGAVVNRNVPKYSIVGGVPAKVIGTRLPSEWGE